jgi:carboxymethylenebutenolidase
MDDPTGEKAKPVVTQEMIALFDDYTHISLDRRKFMDNLAKLCGSVAAATTVAGLMASNAEAAGLVPEDDPRLSIETVTYKGAKGDMTGYLAKPKQGGPFPAAIVVHENRGLSPHIKDVTRRMALEGFLALGPDFLSGVGGTPANEQEARARFMQLDMTGVTADGLATINYLETAPGSTGKAGVIGFCWGGGVANSMAVESPDLKAAVAYYGGQPRAEDVPRIKASLMLHYAGLDQRVNAGIPAFQEALKKAGKDYKLFVYDGANHAFNNDTAAARYDKPASDLAWSRTVAFLKGKLA